MATEPGTHDLWLENAALYAIDAIQGDERRVFEDHLRTCGECRAEIESLRPVNAAMASAVPQIDPPFALRQRVMDAALGPASRRSDSASSVAGLERLAPAGTSAYWLATAAALVLTAGIGAYAYLLQGRLTKVQGELASVREQAEASRSEAETARTAVDSTRRLLDVLMAPDSTRVALAGGKPAPDASGRADWSRSRGLAVSTANLPSVRPGRTYQVWLLTKGAPVSAGLLRPEQSTVVYTDLPAGVQPIGFALSEEPEGGVPAPTGEIYLVGQFAAIPR